jgi:hypothetical protein
MWLDAWASLRVGQCVLPLTAQASADITVNEKCNSCLKPVWPLEEVLEEVLEELLGKEQYVTA